MINYDQQSDSRLLFTFGLAICPVDGKNKWISS